MSRRISLISLYQGYDIFLLLFFLVVLFLGISLLELWKHKQFVERVILFRMMIVDIDEMEINYKRVMGIDQNSKANIQNIINPREEQNSVMQKRLNKWQKEINKLNRVMSLLDKIYKKISKDKYLELIARIRGRIRELRRLMQQPPIIELSEAEGYFFESGSYVIGEEFKELLRNKISRKIIDYSEIYSIDQIEIIGHTDEQPDDCPPSNLDQNLVAYVHGDNVRLVTCGNVELGMARAATVARILRENNGIRGFKMVVMSAGQLVDRNGNLPLNNNGYLNGEQKELRRIELRLKRSDNAKT